jgi:hypothetical protein
VSDRIATSRRIAAPASVIFAVVSDPVGHVRIDGSGMLVASDGPARLSAVGDAFEMDMDREPLGDLPLGRYRVRNVVTRIEPDVLIEWSVAGVGRSPIGHVYGYELAAVSADETEVTSYCDWSAISPKWRQRVSWPVVPVHMLARSLENLDRLVTGQSTVDAK